MTEGTPAARLLALSGSVADVIYQNESNGYAVFEIETDDDRIVATGVCPALSVGEQITVYGGWVHHPEYGRQFQFGTYEKHLPATAAAILRYLSSGAVKGIGPATAKKIVDAFGEDTFEVMENNPTWLSNIPGITLGKAKKISEEFKAVAGIRTVMMFFRESLGAAASVRVYHKWGAAAVDKVKQDPYILCREIPGIGFEKADGIAASLGTKATDTSRLSAGLGYVLSYNASRNGHVCMPVPKLLSAAAETLGCRADDVEPVLVRAFSTGELCRVKGEDGEMAMLPKYYEAENDVAQKLRTLDRYATSQTRDDSVRLVEMAEAEQGISYDPTQRRAIHDALYAGVFVLTGGPGTGKTTVIRGLIGIFESMGLRVSLAAPTGRAAKRMSEATGRDAMTVHRLLEVERGKDEEPRFLRNENNLLEADVVIIDEVSMMDILLTAALLRAVKRGARLILIGDSSQLPSVGPGNVLSDIISSGVFRMVKLTQVFRQAAESRIVTGAHAVNEGRYPDISHTDGDLFFVRRTGDEAIARTVCDLCVNRLPKAYGDMARNGLQVISPSRKGASGTVNLNLLLKEALNPPSGNKRELAVKGRVFREGDRVMQIRNNYDILWEKDGHEGSGVFNGDIGVITDIEHSREFMRITFDEREVKYDFSLLDDLDHAYAVTVHKSQGSEYPIVVLPLYDCAPMLKSRNLLYTALTRARVIAVLVGEERVLHEMVDNCREILRYTHLRECLRKTLPDGGAGV